MSRSKPSLPRVVFWLGVVSFATDVSGEMIYPLIPLFLTSVLHASAGFVGAIEGTAETVASLLKLVSGRISDRMERRKPLTVLGYGLSSLMRPLVGLATAPWMVLGVRVADRVGKGLRSSPRDALLADATPLSQRGRAYGFHNAMDNAGAVLGPAVATLLLSVGHLDLRRVFLLASVPAAAAVLALIIGVKEEGRHAGALPGRADATERQNPSAHTTSGVFRRYLLLLALFGLSNSSDAFLLLRARQLGVAQSLIPVLWMLHNSVKAALSTAGGALSDRLGRRRPIAVGWFIYAISYLGFALAHSAWQAWLLFALYGLYYATVEGSEKALIADLVPAAARGRAFGLYYAITGVVALPASLGFGALADRYGAPVPLIASAAMAATAGLLLLALVPDPAH